MKLIHLLNLRQLAGWVLQWAGLHLPPDDGHTAGCCLRWEHCTRCALRWAWGHCRWTGQCPQSHGALLRKESPGSECIEIVITAEWHYTVMQLLDDEDNKMFLWFVHSITKHYIQIKLFVCFYPPPPTPTTPPKCVEYEYSGTSLQGTPKSKLTLNKSQHKWNRMINHKIPPLKAAI